MCIHKHISSVCSIFCFCQVLISGAAFVIIYYYLLPQSI